MVSESSWVKIVLKLTVTALIEKKIFSRNEKLDDIAVRMKLTDKDGPLSAYIVRTLQTVCMVQLAS